MKRLFQFVSLALLLPMLVPPVFAATVCGQSMEKTGCSCCQQMDGAAMPMADEAMAATGGAQVRSTACCAVTEVEASLPASPADGPGADQVLWLAPSSTTPSPLLSADRPLRAAFPPGASARGPALARLCAFLI